MSEKIYQLCERGRKFKVELSYLYLLLGMLKNWK